MSLQFIKERAADDEEEAWRMLTGKLALASDLDTQHAVAAAAALVHLGLGAVP